MRAEPVESRAVDAIVIGGGFYGARVGLMLARHGRSVLLLERESALLQRASLVNQARVHTGYHYPRSILTSRRSRVNYAQFVAEYPGCVVDDFTHYYAIGRAESKITAAQFVEFCKRIDAPVAPAPDAIRKLFDARRIDGVFQVRECAFDARALASHVGRELDAAGVDVRTGATVYECRKGPGGDGRMRVKWIESDGERQACRTRRWCSNCTYFRAGAQRRARGRRSRADSAQARVGGDGAGGAAACPSCKVMAVTVMDGPFFSLMPHLRATWALRAEPRALYAAPPVVGYACGRNACRASGDCWRRGHRKGRGHGPTSHALCAHAARCRAIPSGDRRGAIRGFAVGSEGAAAAE